VLFPSYARAGEDGWIYAGKTDNGQYVFYIETQNISYPSENTVKFLAKILPSPERKEQMRKTLEEGNKEAEKEFKVKVQDTEVLLNVFMKNETKEFILEIDCLNNRIKEYQPDSSTLVAEGEFSPNSIWETMQKMTCKKR
jgi:hypothetical protein